MKIYSIYVLLLLWVISIFNYNLFAQTDSIKTSDNNKFEFIPAFHGIQVDGNIFFISYEIGGQLDFDLLQSKSNVCLGTRISVENYMQGDVGGKTFGAPFTNYNLYLRFSKISEDLSFNFLGGITYYNSSEPEYFPDKVLPRLGFEIKYGRVVGIILKGATSFKENTGFVGIGLSIDYCHIL